MCLTLGHLEQGNVLHLVQTVLFLMLSSKSVYANQDLSMQEGYAFNVKDHFQDGTLLRSNASAYQEQQFISANVTLAGRIQHTVLRRKSATAIRVLSVMELFAGNLKMWQVDSQLYFHKRQTIQKLHETLLTFSE